MTKWLWGFIFSFAFSGYRLGTEILRVFISSSEFDFQSDVLINSFYLFLMAQLPKSLQNISYFPV